MWTTLGTLLLGILKWVVDNQAKKTLSDKQFVEFIEAHQNRRLGTGKAANDFDDALQETLANMDKEVKPESLD